MRITYLFFLVSFFFVNQSLFGQHDSLFHKYQIGLKAGGVYTLTSTETKKITTSQNGGEQIFHKIGTAENGYGYNFGIFGLYKINDWLNIQAELDLTQITSEFDYNTSTRIGEVGTIENTYLSQGENTGTGFYELKELHFQIPIMAKVLFGKDWKFAIGLGGYFRGGGFSNSSWTYDQHKYFRQIQGNWAPEDPPLVNEKISEQTQLIKKMNFGFLIDLAAVRPINKTQSLFLEFRYQQPFSDESTVPLFSQTNLVVSIGFMGRILLPSEDDEFKPDDGFGEDEELKKAKRKKERIDDF